MCACACVCTCCVRMCLSACFPVCVRVRIVILAGFVKLVGEGCVIIAFPRVPPRSLRVLLEAAMR